MNARIALQLNTQRSGPRPLNLMRDLGEVADLLDVAFGREMDASGRQMIRDARMMSRTGPFLYLLAALSGIRAGLSPGFVWEENSRIIANATMMRSQRRPGNWQIANVAVHPDHRRRGIATRLLVRVFEHIRQLGGHTVSLQVKEDNPAVRLYERLGFQSLGGITRWQIEGRLNIGGILSRDQPVHRARRNEWQLIWNLFRSATPAAQGWPEPLTEQDFRPDGWRWLSELAAGRHVRRWVVHSLDGFVELQSWPNGNYRLGLRVKPEASRRVEGDLLRAALQRVAREPYPQVVADHPSGDVAAEGRLREAGFRPLRTLLLMELTLD